MESILAEINDWKSVKKCRKNAQIFSSMSSVPIFKCRICVRTIYVNYFIVVHLTIAYYCILLQPIPFEIYDRMKENQFKTDRTHWILVKFPKEWKTSEIDGMKSFQFNEVMEFENERKKNKSANTKKKLWFHLSNAANRWLNIQFFISFLLSNCYIFMLLFERYNAICKMMQTRRKKSCVQIEFLFLLFIHQLKCTSIHSTLTIFIVMQTS